MKRESNVPVTPGGRPKTLRLTPSTDVALTVKVTDVFKSSLAVAGDTLSINGAAEVVAQAVTARYTFNLPPVEVLSASDGRTSTVFSRSAFKSAVDNGHTESTRAAAPATIGVAMDVPLRYA